MDWRTYSPIPLRSALSARTSLVPAFCATTAKATSTGGTLLAIRWPRRRLNVIMMLGVGDRQDIGERDLAKEADAKAKDQKDQQAKDEADKKSGQKPAKPDSPAKAENPEEV